MKNEIKELSKIVDWVYESKPTGSDMLAGEEAFDKLFTRIENMKMTKDEYLEFQFLEYEYELNHTYRFMNTFPVIIDNVMWSLKKILEQAESHQRIKKLTERIFSTGLIAAEEQAKVLGESTDEPFQLAWLWEEYAEQYVLCKKYNEALNYYWKALDIYLAVAKNSDFNVKRIIFYDGNSVLHISDIIYRMYHKAVSAGHLWNECIQEFEKRDGKLNEYSYSYLYLAGAQLEKAMQLKGSREMLEAALATIRKLGSSGLSAGGWTIECNCLYYLGKYQSVLKAYEKAVQECSSSGEMQACRKLAFFAALNMVSTSIDQNNVRLFQEMMEKAADYFVNLPVSALDEAKRYISIFDFYNKYKQFARTEPDLIIRFFDLAEASYILMEQLRFNNKKADLGYYTSLSSLYFVLNDDEGEIKQRLSLFDARHMNDPNEGRVLADYLGRQARENYIDHNAETKRRLYDDTLTFLKSFTTNVDSLPMWVQYGDGGKGCFVRVDQKMFENGQNLVESKKDLGINNLRMEESYFLYHVAYFDGKEFRISTGKSVTSYVEKIKNIYNEITGMVEKCSEEIKAAVEKVVDHILKRIQYLIKKDDYMSEEEVRIFFLRKGDEDDIQNTEIQEGGMPRIYLRLKVATEIKEIILGPKVGNGYDKVPYIYWKLQKNSGQTDIKITQSSIEYV